MYADVVLPASAWPEKDGTVTNSNRQVQMGRQAFEPPGDARQDWWIIQEIARRIGLDWDYSGPADVFAEMKTVMGSLDNITWERLLGESSVTYPCPAPDEPGHDIVFGEGGFLDTIDTEPAEASAELLKSMFGDSARVIHRLHPWIPEAFVEDLLYSRETLGYVTTS